MHIISAAAEQEAHDMAIKALKELEKFTDKNLEVVLFSGEGDAIHQIFDCIVMGPFSRVDFWDRGAGECQKVMMQQAKSFASVSK